MNQDQTICWYLLLFFPSDLLHRYVRLPLLILVFTMLPIGTLRRLNISLFLSINILFQV